MLTIAEFLKYKNRCPICKNDLSPMLWEANGNISMIQTADHLTSRRAIYKRIVDGGNIDYVVEIHFSLYSNELYVDFKNDTREKKLDIIPIRFIKEFETFRSGISLFQNPYTLSNACDVCDYEYRSNLILNFKNKSFVIQPVKIELFNVGKTHSIINKLQNKSSDVFVRSDETNNLNVYQLRWLIDELNNSFKHHLVPQNSIIQLSNFYCDPSNIENLKKDLETLYFFS